MDGVINRLVDWLEAQIAWAEAETEVVRTSPDFEAGREGQLVQIRSRLATLESVLEKVNKLKSSGQPEKDLTPG